MKKKFTDYLKLTEGYKILPSIDADRYPEIDGLEGPFRTLSGAVVYYDPKEGKYYDKDKDMYLSYDEFRELDNDYSDMRDERDLVKQEGNEFAHELKKARDSGKEEFEVDGKTYQVKENHKDGAVGYVELFFGDPDGEEHSQEVEVTMVNGKLEVTDGMPGPEDNLYWDDADIEEQLEDALRNGDINWKSDTPELSRIKKLAGL